MNDGNALEIAFRVGPFPKLSETFVLDQIKGMIARGHSVRVVADEPGDVVAGDPALAWLNELAGVDYVNFSRPILSRLWARMPYRLRHARRRSLEHKMCAQNDVVICNFGWFGESVVANAGEPRRAKVITIFHGADMSSTALAAGALPYPNLFAKGDLLLPISDFWRHRLLDAGAPSQRSLVHRMGVDLDAFAFRARDVEKAAPFRFISVCRFVEKKGMEYALRAISALQARGLGGELQFDIVGNGPLEAELRALSKEMGIDEAVHFLGERSHAEIADSLSDADAFVLPSVVASNGDMEGIPVSLMEAMASGLPVISTRHSGIPELIEDGVNGLLADERDVEGLADVMMRMMRDSALRSQLAAVARETVAERFNSRKLNDQLSHFVRALASGEPPAQIS